MSRYVEVNHELTDGMAVFPGLPAPRVTAILGHAQSRDHYAGQAEFYLLPIKTTEESLGRTPLPPKDQA